MSDAIWMVRAGRDAVSIEDFLTKNIVAIGWGEIGDLGNVHGRDNISALLERSFPEYNKFQRAANAGQIYRFRDELAVGETVLTYDPNERLYHVGEIVGDYKYQPGNSEFIRHTRAVKWTGVIPRDELSAASKNALGSISTIFSVRDAVADELRSLLRNDREPHEAQVKSEDVVEEGVSEVRRDTEQRALEFLQDKLSKLDWEQMQDLVAGLLRAMGYKTRVSAKGADRGKDIVASPDGFGFQAPHIRVEVKHRQGSMGAPEVRSFLGGLRQHVNGLYVSTGGFSREARYEAERSNQNILLMDAVELGEAIVEHYDKMDAETRAILPLRKIYWPA